MIGARVIPGSSLRWRSILHLPLYGRLDAALVKLKSGSSLLIDRRSSWVSGGRRLFLEWWRRTRAAPGKKKPSPDFLYD